MEEFSAETKQWINEGWETRKNHFPDVIGFDYPVATESISLTGTSCELNCAHCGQHYLKGMTDLADVKVPREEEDGSSYRSALISGGCTSEGKVPFTAHLDLLHELKKSRHLNFHVGLLDDEEIPLLKGLADVVSFDFVGDQETIEEVYRLKRSLVDYIHVYQNLKKQVQVMPHLTLGLRGGEWGGEAKALDLLEELGLDGLVFLVFIPTPGTRYADRQPPELESVIRFLAQARLRFPDISLSLGCMRPKGQYRKKLDEAGVALGLNRIVLPTPDARRLAVERGLSVVRGEECCAL
ncbi:radical SAM protein [Desulfitobacterium sp.]|uniref:radical SAM protein n=1 Tax=Desulfitobacterium sp. TaxID=49981 RepID=UPI002B90536E|nr:radical SAM protein [Desulfitobacterium sp.]HVJ48225.1 radical SAM protein [Desulfitobacterium sp.]